MVYKHKSLLTEFFMLEFLLVYLAVYVFAVYNTLCAAHDASLAVRKSMIRFIDKTFQTHIDSSRGEVRKKLLANRDGVAHMLDTVLSTISDVCKKSIYARCLVTSPFYVVSCIIDDESTHKSNTQYFVKTYVDILSHENVISEYSELGTDKYFECLKELKSKFHIE